MIKIAQNRNVMALGIALIFAIMGTFLVKWVVDQRLEHATQEGKTKNFVVASADLPEGTTVNIYDSQVFSLRPIPEDWWQSNAVSEEQAQGIQGGVLTTAVKRGEMIVWPMVDVNANQEITNKILVGRRAVTIPVDDESSISSMLKPNDIIDLILSFQQHDQIKSVVLMNGVKILATGNKVTEQTGSELYEQSNYTTITLDVTLEEAKNIIAAAQLGKITAVLRNPEDLSTGGTAFVVGQSQQRPEPYPQTRLPEQPKYHAPIQNPSTLPTAPVDRTGLNIVYGNQESQHEE